MVCREPCTDGGVLHHACGIAYWDFKQALAQEKYKKDWEGFLKKRSENKSKEFIPATE